MGPTCAAAMAATFRTTLAFQLAVRLLHDYPWHPPPTLTTKEAWLAVGIAACYAAVEILLLRTLLMFSGLFLPGVRGILGRSYLGWRDGDETFWALLLLMGAAILMVSDVLQCGWKAYRAAGVLAPRRLVQLQRRLAVTCFATADGVWEGALPVVTYLAFELVVGVATKVLMFWSCAHWLYGRPPTAEDVGAWDFLFAWAAVAVWTACGLAIVLQFVAPPPLKPITYQVTGGEAVADHAGLALVAEGVGGT